MYKERKSLFQWTETLKRNRNEYLTADKTNR